MRRKLQAVDDLRDPLKDVMFTGLGAASGTTGSTAVTGNQINQGRNIHRLAQEKADAKPIAFHDRLRRCEGGQNINCRLLAGRKLGQLI